MAEKFIALFKQHPVGFLGGCVYNDKCKIENVRVECGVRTRKRRETLKTRQTPRPYLQVAFTITVPLPNTSYQELNITTQELSQNISSDLEQMELDLNVSGVEMQVDKSVSPVITVTDYVCDKGQVRIKSHCGKFLSSPSPLPPPLTRMTELYKLLKQLPPLSLETSIPVIETLFST